MIATADTVRATSILVGLEFLALPLADKTSMFHEPAGTSPAKSHDIEVAVGEVGVQDVPPT